MLALRASLCSLALLAFGSVCPANAQSTDDVHVVPAPRAVGTATNAGSALTAVNLSPSPLRPKPLRLDVDLVLVPVTVTDRYNRLVTGLQKQDFTLLEAEAPQPIRYFSSDDAPISLGIILDTSASMKDKIQDARDAVIQFFNNSNPADDYFVITFADSPRVLADSTRSIGFIRDRLASAEPRGRTALLDAVYLGVNKMHRARYGRRALLVISDGGDNTSRYTERELRRIVEESDVEIYAIGIFDRVMKMFLPPEERHGKKLLSDISEATGGRMIELHTSKDLPDIAREVSLELRDQYVLGYRPQIEARDGKWRGIRVTLASAARRGELRVHSKKGYLGPEE